MPRQSIPCPSCKGPITLDTDELLKGRSFTCDACSTTIRITAEFAPDIAAAARIIATGALTEGLDLSLEAQA